MAILKFAILLVTRNMVRRGFVPLLILLYSLNVQAGIKENLLKLYVDCEVATKSIFLTSEQKKEISELNSTKKTAAFYTYYTLECDKRVHNVFVLNDMIRTQKQFILFEFNKDQLEKIKLLKFDEPLEYKMSDKWYKAQMKKTTVDVVSGATLTSRSTNFLLLLARKLNAIISSNGKK